jgi:hypothetical protein
MNAQHWRDYLNTDLSSLSELTGNDTLSAQRRLHIRDVLETKAMVPQCVAGAPFFWQGNQYLPGRLPPDNVIRQVLWELYELNFAQEFVSLDRRACEILDRANHEILYEQQISISKCFVSNTLSYAPLPNTNCGLAADTIKDRIPYLRRMVRIMKTWKGIKPAIFDRAESLRLTDQQAGDIEDAVTKYYCQQFYNYFGRAAQIPHRLLPRFN